MKIGLWSWNLPFDQHNWWPAYVDRIKASGASIWLPKILDGEGYYNGVRLEPATLYARQYDLDVWAWGYERDGRFADPATEGSKLGFRSQMLHASAVVADVEAEWTPEDSSVAPFLRAVRTGFSGKGPVYFSSYSTTRYHPEFPWKEFLAATDGVVPQEYQGPAGEWLDKILQDFGAFGLGVEKIIPVGLADKSVGSETELISFLSAAKDRKFPVVTLWVIDHMTDRHWSIVKEHAA